MPTSQPTWTPTSTHAGVRVLHGGAAILLIAAVPVAVAGLLGQDDEQGVPRSELDYAIRPLDIAPGWMTAIGVAALLLAAASAAFLARRGRRAADRHRYRHQWQTICPLVGIGVILGLGYHIATAGVIGANIGFGLVVLFGPPLVVVLLVVAAIRRRALRVEARRHAP
ncbi:hypothetical protein CC117_26935 [Parafrankia colletiae]|uniref:Uncharacterized protein n=1 Tax=Parafrankia colletiae TaxID=573497 RepID=A0A1S1QD83_9ACTN|nr:hypothetical protein [Parafrankia colletiae]MCK9903467.1 hypothetical protein [Frankia sp. Cpl3]OHV31165.1 hypothetical protein CC117_26935 [Parafrankia colletiae]